MRINKKLNKQEKESLNHNPSFEEWLNYYSKEPTSKELDDMERDSFKITSINNTNYQPLQGA